MLFKWYKTHGCNCHPVAEGGERYHLDVARLYQGRVELNPQSVGWEAEVSVCGKTDTGQGGGGMTRDEGMAWVESVIKEHLKDLGHAVIGGPSQREIYDALYREDEETGELYQPRLE